MRKILGALFALLAGSGTAIAQTENYNVGPASAANVATLAATILGKNGDLCASFGLQRTCTQAQICTAANVAGACSTTASIARAAGVRLFPATQAGREEFVTHEIALKRFNEMVGQQKEENRRASCAAWVASSEATKNTICQSLGFPNASPPSCDLGC